MAPEARITFKWLDRDYPDIPLKKLPVILGAD